MNKDDFIDYSIKNVKYYKSLYNLIFLYTNELKEIISDKFMINYINEEINDEIVKKLIKKIEKYNSSPKEIINLLKLTKNILKLAKLLSFHISIINEIDIFDKKILMSDTSKNNINKNKLHILDINKIHSTNINANNIIIIKEIVKELNTHVKHDDSNINKSLSNIDTVNNYFQKHHELIDFYVQFIDSVKSHTDKNQKIIDYIDVILEQDKSRLLQKDLENLEIICNKNIEIYLSYENKKKSTKVDKSIITIKNNLNIVKTFNNFKLHLQFDSFENILDHHNISYKAFSKGDLKSKLENINKVLIDHEKNNKKKIIFVLIECKKDLISYNINNLLNNNIKVDKASGINDNYLIKTNTIVESQNDDINNIYISNIQKIHIINSPMETKQSKLIIDYDTYNSKIILVHTYNYKSFNLMSNSDINESIKFSDIIPLIKNQPSYNIENYNSLLENNILKNIEEKSILDEYHKTMQFDIKSYGLENTLQMKNNIMDDIYSKIKLKFTFENKNAVTDMILDIIIDNISLYIKNKNKIEYDAETYMTYLFSVNSLMNKFKKDIIDNYDDNFLDKLDTLIDNIYKKILNINDNVVDKYYYTHIIDN